MSTQKTVAQHLFLSDRRVRQLLEEGILPAAHQTKGLSLTGCRKAYIEYLKKSPKQSEKALALEEQRVLESQERTRKLRRENDIEDRKIISHEEVIDLLQAVSKQAATIFDGLPLNIKRRVPVLKAKDIEYVKLEIAKARNAFAKMTIEGPKSA